MRRATSTPHRATLSIGVDDVDAFAQELASGDIELEPTTVPSGQFRLAQLQDPAGNTVVLSRSLT